MAWQDVEEQPAESGWVDVETTETATTTGAGTDADPIVLKPMDISEVAPETYKADRQEEEADMSQTVAEVKQAITTIADQLGVTDDSEKSMTKYRKEVTRVLTEKGFRVENRGGKLTAVDSYGKDIDIEEGMIDSLKASSGEMLGGVGVGIAGGAAGGALGGPVGAIGGGIVGGVAGAIAGDQLDVSLNADKHGIKISPEERMDRAVEVGAVDALASAGGAVVAKGIGKLALASDTFVRNIIGADARGVNDLFTSVADASAPVQKAIKTLQEQSGMSDELVEQTIKDYSKTIDGELSAGKAVEALSKSAEKEQTGYAIAAMDDPLAKSGAIDEMTKRTKEVEKAFGGDEELEAILKKHTVDDEGRRKATDWQGLQTSLDRLGFEKGDPIYDKVATSAKSLGSKEKDIFKATVKPGKADEGIVDTLSPFADTARGSVKSQLFATGIQSLDNLLTRVLPNADATTVNIIRSSMKNKTTPEKLSNELIAQGHEVQSARKVAREVIKAQTEATKENKVFEATKVKESKAMEAGLAKEAKAKEVKTAKETKAKEVAEAKTVKEETALLRESKKRTGFDWDDANLDGTVTKKDKDRLKEARRRAQMDTTNDLSTNASDDAVSKIEKEILDKKKGVVDRKAKLDKLKKEADEPIAEKIDPMRVGLKQTKMDLEDEGLFAKPKKSKTTVPKRKKATQNQEDATKAKDANPDDGEAIQKALFKKNPEVQAKKSAEEGLAKEKYERSLDPRTDAEIKANDAVDKAVEGGVDLYETKPIYNKSMVESTIPKRAEEFSKWTDENPTKEFLHYAKEKSLTTKEVESYYKGTGKDVPKSWVKTKVKPKVKSNPMESNLSGIRRSPATIKIIDGLEGVSKGMSKELDGVKEIAKVVAKKFSSGDLTQEQIVKAYGGKVPTQITKSKKWLKGD